ncbi:MAG: SH3 domain-containing protein [Synergistaceae bacterium]|nr:SH3 domain-containing protein [Synergistaceae bacterium]
MSWIILALTLGASITSIIHGVFMLFGSLSITAGGALIGMPSTLLASLPIIAAVFALIGGIIAFNQSKWGALFLFTAAGICAPARDTWLYAGLYFFAALFCFFLKKKDNYIYGGDDYDDLDPNSGLDPDSDTDQDLESASDFGIYPPKRGQADEGDFYYEEQIVPRQPKLQINPDTLVEDNEPEVISRFQAVPPANEQPVKVRTRPSKTCPTCGMNVARDAKFCSQCGTKLFVAPEVMAEKPSLELGLEHEHEQEDALDFHSSTGINNNANDINNNSNADADNDNNNNMEMETEMETMDYAYRVSLNDAGGRHGEQRFRAQGQGRKARKNPAMSDDAASSYRDFSDSKYSKRGKKRRRSPFRRVLSILLLVGAVGGALYFLLGLRKLPPGDLPPIAKPEVVRVNTNNNDPRPPARDVNNDMNIVEPVDVVVAENILPNFTPNRTPTSGVITGNGVNVRADHSTSSARVTRLSNGTKVEVTDSWTGRSGNLNGTWYNIRTGGKDGWVYGQYMQALGSGLPAGYSNGLLKSFGNNKAQLIETLGQPSKSSNTSAEWQGLTATLKGDDITRIRLSSSRHELQNGLKVGMSQTALLQIMGFPSSVNKNTMNYNEGSSASASASTSTGVSVVLDRSNLITSITVNAVK